jgi:hypothetical protein
MWMAGASPAVTKVSMKSVRHAGQFRVHDLAVDCHARVVRPMPGLSREFDADVERLWQPAASRVARGGGGTLFNGQVFSADSITPHLIAGHLTEFRRVVAQMEQPSLFKVLRLRPLAVCGVVNCADGVVFARRHASAVYQPGMWQLPPAGSVDGHAVNTDGTVALNRQLLDELREELGLAAIDVDEPRPLCIVEHAGSHVSDFGMALRCRLDGAAILAAHAERGNREYQSVCIVPQEELARFVADNGALMVPPAPVFLHRAGLL